MPETHWPAASTEAAPDEELSCDNCGAVVDQEGLFHNEQLGLAVCEDCDLAHAPWPCPHCGEEYSDEDSAQDCCGYECPRCGSRFSDSYSADICCPVHYCPDCEAEWDSEDDAYGCCRRGGRAYPPLADLQEVYLLSIPELPNRPARVCSIEQEINDGGREVTQMLYDLGFAETASQIGYSASGRAGTVAVKSDASLSGDDPAEIVYSRYRLWNEASTESLSEALARVRQLARETTPGVVRVNKSAGTHVHISATADDGSRIGPSEMAALHEIFSYAEDFLYSVAAAGWDSHRSPIGVHGTYCKPVPKLASGERGTAFRLNTLMRGDRYFGLNFQRLLAAATNCSCGAARFGEWSACECGAFDSATVEWRLFNASTKPETLHAWLILSHALTALAMTHRLGTLPVNAYGGSDLTSRKEVQSWIEQNAPLTDDEIQVIRAAVARSKRMKRDDR